MNPLVTVYLVFSLKNTLALLLPPDSSKNATHKFIYERIDLNDHTLVSKSDIFPYVAAILKKGAYLSAGALIDENFVLTAADSLFLHLWCTKDVTMCKLFPNKLAHDDQVDHIPNLRVRESKRVLRVRLGSINYKKGGILFPIKYVEIHPFFTDMNPEYDIALIKLAHPVRYTPSMNPIRLQKNHRDVSATHFIVNAWPAPTGRTSEELQQLQSMEDIKRRRILQVSHLHPTEAEKCEEEMEGVDVNTTNTLMCLDPALGSEPCSREVGAPVVLNGILWGIMSSWRSEDCEIEPAPSFVSLVSSPDTYSWIHSTTRGHRWNKSYKGTLSDGLAEDYDDNNI